MNSLTTIRSTCSSSWLFRASVDSQPIKRRCEAISLVQDQYVSRMKDATALRSQTELTPAQFAEADGANMLGIAQIDKQINGKGANKSTFARPKPIRGIWPPLHRRADRDVLHLAPDEGVRCPERDQRDGQVQDRDWLRGNAAGSAEKTALLADTDGLIPITVKPYMRTYKRVILPTRQVDLLPPMDIGSQVEIDILLDDIKGNGRIEHRAHTGGSSITVLYFRGEIGKAIAGLDLETKLYLRPVLGEDGDSIQQMDLLRTEDLSSSSTI